MNSTKLQSITYYSAFQAGDGLATITYNFGPSVTSFTTPVSPSKAQTPVFNLTFGQSVTGLTADDFTFTGTSTSCYVSQVTGSGATYAITVSGCTDGTVALSLKADSVFGNAIGPVRAVATSTITLDRTLPEINSLTKQPSSNDLVIYKAVFTGLVLNSLAVSDSAGNIGPSLSNQTPVTKIDTTAPKFAVFDVTAPGVGGTPSWVFDSEEPVNGMSAAKFVFSGTATGCQLNYTVLRTGLGWQITLNNCSIGTAQVTLVANAVSDNANNLGPTTALASNQLTITPDEVVNQSVNPPSGNQGAAVSDKPKKIVDKVEPIPQVELEPEPTIMVEPIDPNLPEVEKPMTTKDKPEAVIEPTAYPFGLFGLALILAVLALGTGRRKVRRRH